MSSCYTSDTEISSASVSFVSEAETKITSAKIKFRSRTPKYTWVDHKRNEDILKELKTEFKFRREQAVA
jgi:hypothetical protein